jgi:carnitine 3-dehydrogenase
MSYNKPIRRIAIVGTGVIGASWAAQYLARGFDVAATDPGPSAEANLRKYVDEAWPDLTNIGLSQGASRDRLSFTTNMKEALSQADLVQENAPERPDFKMELYAEMDDVTPVDSLLASSSSGITPSSQRPSYQRAALVRYSRRSCVSHSGLIKNGPSVNQHLYII